MRAEIRVLLNDMLQRDINRWALPIYVVCRIPSSTYANVVTREDAFLLSRIDNILETLAGSQLFNY